MESEKLNHNAHKHTYTPAATSRCMDGIVQSYERWPSPLLPVAQQPKNDPTKHRRRTIKSSDKRSFAIESNKHVIVVDLVDLQDGRLNSRSSEGTNACDALTCACCSYINNSSSNSSHIDKKYQ